jgi:hypothetical protein
MSGYWPHISNILTVDQAHPKIAVPENVAFSARCCRARHLGVEHTRDMPLLQCLKSGAGWLFVLRARARS